MTVSEAFELGWIVGSVMNFQHPDNKARGKGYDFQEALRRFEKSTKTPNTDFNLTPPSESQVKS